MAPEISSSCLKTPSILPEADKASLTSLICYFKIHFNITYNLTVTRAYNMSIDFRFRTKYLHALFLSFLYATHPLHLISFDFMMFLTLMMMMMIIIIIIIITRIFVEEYKLSPTKLVIIQFCQFLFSCPMRTVFLRNLRMR